MSQKLTEDEIRLRMRPLLECVPIISLPFPRGWKFEPVTIVTAQLVAGTGLFAEVVSEVTDIFGRRSGIFERKIRAAEDECKARLRFEAASVEAHAVIDVDVDYAEVGGAKAMLMVCMTGTAVRIGNAEQVLGANHTALMRAQEALSDLQNPPCGWCGRKLDKKFRTCTSFSEDELASVRAKVRDPVCLKEIERNVGP